MPTAKEAYDAKRSSSTTPLLHGGDLPRKQSTITLQCTNIRMAPEQFSSPAIMDFEPIKIAGNEYGAVALNKTNMRVIMEILGEDVELEGCKGKATFTKILVNNPSTKTQAWGLLLTGFDAARRPKPKAGPASRRGGKLPARRNVAKDEDVPF